LQESRHVYIKEGLEFCSDLFRKRVLRIFELGYGTGLNAQLTSSYAYQNKQKVHYTSIEKYPLPEKQMLELNYGEYFESDAERRHFAHIVKADWNVTTRIHEFFDLEKVEGDFFEYQNNQEPYDLIYFDAFGHRAQSDLWEKVPFEICNGLLQNGGVLVTYASKGSARRNMIEAGFEVVKLPGPPGKREMMRATKAR
jgi:tRNA U34 5-methylaminomethyl-2-thiouridine-forming methyltransferase MnmC